MIVIRMEKVGNVLIKVNSFIMCQKFITTVYEYAFFGVTMTCIGFTLGKSHKSKIEWRNSVEKRLKDISNKVD